MQVRHVIAGQANQIDRDYVNTWCDELDTPELLETIRASISQI